MHDSMISRTELLRYLNDVEKRFPVDEWKIGEINIWPLIKIDLFFRLVAIERNGERSANKTKKGIAEKVRIGIKSLKSLFHYLLLKYSIKEEDIPYFFSDSSSHRVWFENEFINRYFKPIKEQIKELKKSKAFLTINDGLSGSDGYPTQENILFINKYSYGSKLLRLLNKKTHEFNCKGFDQFVEDINRDLTILRIGTDYKKILYSRVCEIYSLSKIIDVLIKNYKPKVIFELCYYSNLRFAINISAYKHQVTTVEIQHGGLGRDHVAYSGWGKVPESGYNLLPQTFWAWDQHSEKIVSDWSRCSSFHKTICAGNPWLVFSLKYKSKYQFPNNKKIILYTLQDTMVEDYIYEAIEKSPDVYEWWVREHPRFPTITREFNNKLNIRRISHRVILKEAKEYPLPILLNKCVVHLSGSSGSILEASLLGVPTLVLDKIGEQYYHELISAGEAFVLHPKTAFTVIDFIELLDKKEKKSDLFIDSNSSLKLLETLI